MLPAKVNSLGKSVHGLAAITALKLNSAQIEKARDERLALSIGKGDLLCALQILDCSLEVAQKKRLMADADAGVIEQRAGLVA